MEEWPVALKCKKTGPGAVLSPLARRSVPSMPIRPRLSGML